MSLAIGTEVGVLADGALVSSANDVAWLGFIFALRTIAVNTNMALLNGRWLRQWLVNRYESMTMGATAVLDTGSTEIKVWAIQTLVADAENCLLTAVADSSMALATAGNAHVAGAFGNDHIFGDRGKGVSRMVSVFAFKNARNTKIVVFALGTRDKDLLWQNSDAGIAGPTRFFVL